MKKKLLLLFVLVFIVCVGCTNQYTLTYEDGIFKCEHAQTYDYFKD